MNINAEGILKKTAKVLNKNFAPIHKSPKDWEWEKVKNDLERLNPVQLKLVLSLIREMEKVNIGDKKAATLTRN